MARALGLLLVVWAAGCRSDVEQARDVFAAAERVQARREQAPRAPAPAAEAPAGDPCAGSPGSLVAATHGVASALRVRDGVVTWAETERGLYAASGAGAVTELLPASDERDITGLDVSAAGVFVIVQTRRSPVKTRLLWRAADGAVVESMTATDVLLNDVVADGDGAWALAGRVLASPGPASQLLRFSIAERSSRVVLERERGTLFLTADDERLYWIEYPHTGRGQSGPSAVVTMPKRQGDVATLWQGPGVLSALAVGREHLYWVRRDDLLESRGTLVRMKKSGGDVEVVRTGVRTAHVLVEGDDVVVETDDESQLHRVDPASGAIERLVDEPVFLARPVLAHGALTWATARAHYEERACIRRLALPAATSRGRGGG